MVEINNIDKFDDISSDNFYVIADFDQTITSHNSNSTFSLFAKSGLYPKEYFEDRTKIFEYFRPLELNPNISYEDKFKLAKEWQKMSYNLMLKYKVRESDIKTILNSQDSLILRKEAIEFINYLNNNSIPLIISSAGIGNFIIEILKKNACYSNNIYIHSNMLEFKDNVIFDNNPKVVHSMCKNQIELPNSYLKKIHNKEYAIIIGDQLSDLEMAKFLPKKEIISFGFLESNVEENKDLFKSNFDVVLTDNESFNPIQKLLTKRG